MLLADQFFLFVGETLMTPRRCLPLCIAFLGLTVSASLSAEPIDVRVVKTDGGYQLLRGGKPYLIKGAGGSGSKELLAKCGGNSLRTWGVEGLQATLDECQQFGLTVAVGIWLGHERHGFNYNNADQVAEQYDRAREAIERFKDHPAVLVWGIGNEMEGYEQGDNAAIWSAINNIASLAKRLDPHHPTMTVVAEIGGQRVKNIHRLCPDIDIVGINSYGGAATIGKRYREAGGVKPYVLTEFGPPGTWELPKNSWGAAPEPTSTEKAEAYRNVYQRAVLGEPDLCLGSYAFTWGFKQEATATWFGLLLPNGGRLGGVDALSELWTGKPPANRCPRIESLKLTGAEQVEPGATVHAKLEANDPENDPLTVRWILQHEAYALGTGGDAEESPPIYPDAIVKSDHTSVELKMPTGGGGYRLFAYISDNHGGAAVANVRLHVNAPVPMPQAKRATLPLVLYDEADREGSPYVPAGWMGNTKAIAVDERSTDQPHAGKTCIKASYREPSGWGGVVWQSPANDWGDKPGGWNLTGAKRLTFWARGAKGGEVVSFELGLLDRNKPFYDTAKAKLEKVTLTTEWKQYSIDLADRDLSRIKTGFVWTLASSGSPVTFYLDDIQYEP
jgi:hypothetical protein